MGEIVRKEVCQCTNCGNEAEMVITCSLPEDVAADPAAGSRSEPTPKQEAPKRVKGVAKCSFCGNEADMWIDF